MWEPRRLKTIWASRACYRDIFTYFYYHTGLLTSEQNISELDINFDSYEILEILTPRGR
jgi:hypothetical protein